MRILLLGLVIAASLAIPRAAALPTPQDDAVAAVDRSVERDVFRETELYCMTLAIYFEGGSTAEPLVGQRHIARVIAERARANRKMWGGRTICGVVFYQANNVCQFSFACLPLARRSPPRKNRHFEMHRWETSAEIAREELEGIRKEAGSRGGGGDDDEPTAARAEPAPDPLIRYYMNPALTPLKNVCRFQKEFVPVVRAGRHDFFREPTSDERRALAQSEPEACKRYAAMLKAKSKKAKLAKLKAKHHKHAAKSQRKKHARVARR